MENGGTNISIENGIAKLTFFHPKSNSLPGDILKRIALEISSLSANSEVKVIVLQSEGEKAFCAGASFDELAAIDTFEKGKEFFMGFARVINAMRKCPKFIITRVQGKTVGGGVGLAAASDYVFAVKGASFKLSELALGIGPFVVGPAVERKIGKAAFTTMSIDYEWRSADWAIHTGLYTEQFASIESMDTALNKFAQKLAAGSLPAMKELKKVFWQGTEHWDELLEKRAEISGKLVLSDFTKNYINEFKSKG